MHGVSRRRPLEAAGGFFYEQRLRAGHIDIRATYRLSDDQKTLTYAYGGNTIVYKRWEAMDW